MPFAHNIFCFDSCEHMCKIEVICMLQIFYGTSFFSTKLSAIQQIHHDNSLNWSHSTSRFLYIGRLLSTTSQANFALFFPVNKASRSILLILFMAKHMWHCCMLRVICVDESYFAIEKVTYRKYYHSQKWWYFTWKIFHATFGV